MPLDVDASLSARLLGYAGIAALVSTRVYPLKKPQGATMPCVTWRKISSVPRPLFDGTGHSYVKTRFQVDAWDDDVLGAKNLAAQIRACFDQFSGQMGGATGVEVAGAWIEDETDFDELSETGTPLYRVSFDIRIDH